LSLHLLLMRGLDFVRRTQLATGEVPSYHRIGREALYSQSPLASALAHDALACLDPFSPRFEREAAGRLPYPGGRWLAAVAVHVRRRIRGFVAWQERPDARFSFLGRGSGLAPDAATTACCAAVLLEGRPPAGRRRSAPAAEPWRRHAQALARHRAADGRFFTYVDAGGRGWAALGARGERTGDFDRVVNAHALRFLALAGEPAGALPDWLLAEAGRDFAEGSPDHPDPLAFAHAAARAFAPLPERESLARALAPRVLERQRPDGSFGGPLATSLALHALLDLGVEDPALAAMAAGGRALVSQAARNGSWRGEAYVRKGGGSASLSTALAVAALLRLAGVFGPELEA